MQAQSDHVVLSAGTLIGDRVENAHGENLGTLKEIMLDTNSGRIAYAVLSFGGFLGLGDKLFAVPWSAFQVDTHDKKLIFNVEKEALEDAPGFDPNDWPDMANHEWGEKVHAHYGYDPYWTKAL